MRKEFEGKTALVTGGSRGIGHAICLDLGKSGARVAVNYTSNSIAAEETVETIRRKGGEAFSVQADVSSSQEVKSMIAQVEEVLGTVDLLVTSAGIVRRENHETLSYEVWKEIMETLIYYHIDYLMSELGHMLLIKRIGWKTRTIGFT